MFDSVWKNVQVATMAPGRGTVAEDRYGIINNAAIAIKNGKIAWIGRAVDLPGKPEEIAEYVLNGGGMMATPGLIDCHTHLVYAGDRAAEFEKRLEGATYAEIAKAGGGIVSTVQATRKASPKQLLDLGAYRLRALFQEGVTTVEIKSGYGLDLETEGKLLRVATALRDETGLRVQRTFLGAHALPPEYKDNSDGYVSLICDEMLPKLAAEGMVDAVDAFCEGIGFSPAQVRRIFDAAKKLNLPVKLHAEQLSDLKGAALAAEYRALSADHLEYIDETGVKAMAAAGMTAVLLPAAFYFLREKQLPPIALFRKHGVPIAIATDHNPGTAPVLSPLLMLNMACTLFRLTPEEALAGMTRHAAKALGYQDICGTLETGKAADIAFWNISHPRELAYHFGHNPCAGVVSGGLWHPFDSDLASP